MRTTPLRYVVSVVYQRQDAGRLLTFLHTAIVTAKSPAEALGILVVKLEDDKDLKDAGLALKTITLIEP